MSSSRKRPCLICCCSSGSWQSRCSAYVNFFFFFLKRNTRLNTREAKTPNSCPVHCLLLKKDRLPTAFAGTTALFELFDPSLLSPQLTRDGQLIQEQPIYNPWLWHDVTWEQKLGHTGRWRRDRKEGGKATWKLPKTEEVLGRAKNMFCWGLLFYLGYKIFPQPPSTRTWPIIGPVHEFPPGLNHGHLSFGFFNSLLTDLVISIPAPPQSNSTL